MRSIIFFSFIVMLIGLQPELAFSKAKDAFEACDHGETEQLKKILATTKSVDIRGKDSETPLIRCASTGNLAGVKMLIERKADPNAVNGVGRSALFYAVSNHQNQVADFLMKNGADVSAHSREKKENLLFEAIRGGNLDLIPEILKLKPTLVNDKNSDGETALFEAVRSEQGGAATILLKQGADRNLKNVHGQKAIDLADPKADVKLIKILSAQ